MPSVWRLIAHHSDSAGVVDLIRKTGQIRIGWGDTGDLSQSPYRSARDVSHAIWLAYPGSTNFRLGGSSLWRFYHEMQIGDLVVVSSKNLCKNLLLLAIKAYGTLLPERLKRCTMEASRTSLALA